MGEKITVAMKLPTALNTGLFVLKGYNTPGVRTEGGYGLTEGVDKDAYEKWVADMMSGPTEQHFKPLAAGLIIAADKLDSLRSQAREQAELASGFEGLDPDNPGAKVEPTEEQKKENAKIERKA